MREITARYRGTCRACGGRFAAGTQILWAGRGRAYHTGHYAPNGAWEPTEVGAEATPRRHGGGYHAPIDNTPGARASAADPRGVYAADGTYLGTTGPRCEDAPCCGCCP